MRPSSSPRDLLDTPLAPEAGLPEALRWAVAHAALAPSELNSQPWHFLVEIDSQGTGAHLQLLLDEARLLPAIDPSSREAVFACGAALLNLRLALHGAALGTTIRLTPDPNRPELLAEVVVAGTGVERDDERRLRRAIVSRGTHRSPFKPGLIPPSVLDHLVAEAAGEGAIVAILDDHERAAFARLNAAAERRLWLEPAYRREVAGGAGAANREPLEPPRPESELIEQAPAVLVLGAPSDARDALVRAGSGMQRLLLCARDLGMSASYLNASLHEPDMRHATSRLAQLDHPQVVLRLGYAEVVAPTSRRPESAILDLRDRSAGPLDVES